MRGEPMLVEQLLKKAKDSAMLATEFYNKPAVSFKSEGFITMMLIAWNSLLHAWFFKNKREPFYRKRNGKKRPRFEIIEEILPNGKKIKEKKWWDISKCVEEYFGSDNKNPTRKNLEFFIPLRNMIVHRNLPELDDTIYGECQALLINFNDFIEKKFGEKHSIKNFLSIGLHLIKSQKNFLEASKVELKKRGAENIVTFIKTYRSALTTEQFESPDYSFKAILIQVKNHESRDVLPIRFIKYDDLSEEQRQKLHETGIVLIKEKQVQVEDTDLLKEYNLTYSDLVKELKNKIPSLKLNNEFHKRKKEIIAEHPYLTHRRKLDPKNPKSAYKDFYKRDIIAKFEELYK